MSVCEEAIKLVHGNRGEDYDHPKRNFARIARLWDGYLHDRLKEGESINMHDVPLMNILQKMGREMFKHKRDNLVDIAGYAETLGMCCEKEVSKSIEDGFGNSWSKTCLACGQDGMVVVRPGKVQCDICDGTGEPLPEALYDDSKCDRCGKPLYDENDECIRGYSFNARTGEHICDSCFAGEPKATCGEKEAYRKELNEAICDKCKDDKWGSLCQPCVEIHRQIAAKHGVKLYGEDNDRNS